MEYIVATFKKGQRGLLAKEVSDYGAWIALDKKQKEWGEGTLLVKITRETLSGSLRFARAICDLKEVAKDVCSGSKGVLQVYGTWMGAEITLALEEDLAFKVKINSQGAVVGFYVKEDCDDLWREISGDDDWERGGWSSLKLAAGLKERVLAEIAETDERDRVTAEKQSAVYEKYQARIRLEDTKLREDFIKEHTDADFKEEDPSFWEKACKLAGTYQEGYEESAGYGYSNIFHAYTLEIGGRTLRKNILVNCDKEE